MLTLFVSGSLLLWHYGDTQGWPALRTWTVAYLMVALGTLAKGPQSLFYFGSVVGVYLLIARRWRDAIRWAHVAAIAMFVAIVAAWQVPFYLSTGWQPMLQIYGKDVALRFDDATWLTYVNHFFAYPAEILFGCMLPWSVLLVAYLNRDFRRKIGAAGSHVLFLVCAIAVTFPTVWFTPGARGRYYLPLYPCFALLIGLVVQRCWETEPTANWQRLWRQFVAGLAVVMVGMGAGVLVASFVGGGKLPFAQPGWFAVTYAVLAAGLALVAFRSRHASTPPRQVVGAVCIAAFMGLTFVGAYTNSLAERSVDHAAMVAELRQKMPADAKMFSLDLAPHVFTYHYGDPVTPVALPQPGDRLPPEVQYVCFRSGFVSPEQLGFPYETLAVIPCDRSWKENSKDYVTVVRRLPERPTSLTADPKLLRR
jgi:4-amino-4-deoxy-L-arabinose transferase-like glycosyltransferase